METRNHLPFIASHPGGLLKDELDARKISQKDFAVEIGMQKTMLNEIIKEKRPVTAETALLLEKTLGISADYWLRFQSQYDLDVARIKEKNIQKLATLETVVSKTPNKWKEESNERYEDKEQLKYSQQVAVRILRTLREKNLTQKYLAETLKVAPQTVTKWLKGSENFTFETIVKIEKALDIKLMCIYENDNSLVSI
jgi:addiction module HigA family antidote